MSSLVKGTLILTFATIISKILGFIYVVPFTALVGTQGYILFEYAYKPYVIILSFATLGVPLAVSKFVSKYNELGDYETGRRLFKSGLVFLSLTGVICFMILFFFAPSIAGVLVDKNDTTGNSIEDIIFVMRMVSFALIIVPPMAIARGFFQGYHSMEPTAISQVVEQLVRIICILAGGAVVIYVLGKGVSFAVGVATFSATIGAIAGCFVLLYYWKKKKPELDELSKQHPAKEQASLPKMYKELISYAIPFVIVGLAIPLYQTIDTFTINQAIMKTGLNQLEAETVNSVVALVQKIILIPVSLATALGLTLVPTITKSFVANDFDTLKSQIAKTFLIIFYLTLPCVGLLMALATPSFSFLFGESQEVLGGQLMLWYAPTAILFGIFIVTSSILQGMDRHKFAIISLMSGLLLKVLTSFMFVVQFGGVGSSISTSLGFILSIILNIWAIKKYSGFTFSAVQKDIFTTILFTVLTSIFVWGFDYLTFEFIEKMFASNFIHTGLRLLIWGSAGFLLFFGISFKTGLMKNALGEDMMNKLISKLKSKLKRQR